MQSAVWTTVIGVMLLAGCGSDSRTAADTTAEPRGGLPRDAVGHVVIFWLKEPGSADGRRQILEASESFRSVPGVLAVETGEKIASPRRNVDKTYDVAVVIWFRDQDALEQYQTHPAHLSMLAHVGPLVDRTVVYDFLAVNANAKSPRTPRSEERE